MRLPVPPLPAVWALEVGQPLLVLGVLYLCHQQASPDVLEVLWGDWLSVATENKPILWNQADMDLNSDVVAYWLCDLGVAHDPFGSQYSHLPNGDETIYLIGLLKPSRLILCK